MIERHLCIFINDKFHIKTKSWQFCSQCNLPRITSKSASRSKDAIEVTSLKHRWVKFQRTGDMAKCGIFGVKKGRFPPGPGGAQQDAISLAGPLVNLFYFPSQSLIWIQFHFVECQRWFPRFHLAHWSSPGIRNIDYTSSLKLPETLYTFISVSWTKLKKK